MKHLHSLTPLQLNLVRYIAGYHLAHNGVSPTLREIQEALGFPAKSNVFRMLCGIEARGWIRRLRNRNRAIEVLADVAVPRTPDLAPLYFVAVRNLHRAKGFPRGA